jgi:APA family basic amino acid/polyamine antiporter
MAEDGLFFPVVARLSPRTNVPVVAIVLQSVWAVAIALTGSYDEILNYQVPIDATFFGLSACCLFVLRRRDQAGAPRDRVFRAPGHPVTTIIFIGACWLVTLTTLWQYPRNSLIGVGILLLGLPVYLWRKRRRNQEVPI